MTQRPDKADFKLPVPLALQDEEREMLTPRDKRTVSQWAEQERVLSKKTTFYSGKWSNDIVPFAVEIMDALSDLTTREVWVRAPAQSSKTEIGLNFLGQTIDDEPMPFSSIMPTEADVKKRFRTRIKPMFEATPSLLRHLPARDINRLRIGQETELDNMFLYLAWAGSAAALADTPIARIWLDEVAKYKDAVGAEAGSVDLARDRTIAWRTVSKLYAPCTPILVGDEHDREYTETDMREYWVKCPYCNQRHIPDWQYVELDKDSAGQLLSAKDYIKGNCARYICPKCEKRWTEEVRWAGSAAGRWAPAGCTVGPDGRIVGKIFSNPRRGYQISSFMLYPGFVTMNMLAAEWASAQRAKRTGNIKPLQNFINSRIGQPWEEREKETDETRLAMHISGYEPEVVPKGVQMLSAGGDVQIDHVWIAILGWGWLSELWLIDERRLETGDTKDLANLDIVADYLSQKWPTAADSEQFLLLRKGAIDCGYRPEVVKDFIRKYPGLPLVPVRGSDTVKARIYNAVKEPDGVMIRYDLNVNAIKDTLWRMMFEKKETGPGYFHLHSKTSKEVLAQLTGEEQVRESRGKNKGKMIWRPKTKSWHSTPVHLWDCTVYAHFAGQIAGATMLRDPEKKIAAAQRRIGQMDRFNR